MTEIIKLDSNQTITEIAIYNGVVYLAGQVPDDDSLDIVGQTREVLTNIDKALAKAGTDKSKLLTAQVFIKDLNDFEQFNAEYTAWIAGNVPPTRATVQANLVNPNWLIEIVVTAAV
ncbi:RidA family protein [Moraxella bovis]|uniref:RidA family protein n=1 Tax=Moraxella bovis TaxID=476 RepID=UPI002226B21C|nr:RidA family protein [Moraxella bovis]UYZ67725.1 RidA family protein [Moraxella bovis]UYZ70098.1 RidA family protein [Moraxella bovis]UYZ73990.1 RidA family protein [Moraxella bovis]UZA13389.1 RidA family protein [Moraxella bovis]UZA28256.1 RidA family protein [Moraxella bovis]